MSKLNLMLRRLTATLLLSLCVWFIGPRDVAALDTKFDLNAGYRTDKLNWNIASDLSGMTAPNVLSELTWDALHIVQLSGGLQLTGSDGLHFRATAAYGWIHDGDNQDSDYLGNGRTLEFSRTNNDTVGDNVWDLSLAFGYRFRYAEDGTATYLIPLVGYSRHAQNLRIANTNQTIPTTGSIPGVNSTYLSRWEGHWMGVEFLTDAPRDVNAYFRLEHHWADYSAEANWNLRTDLEHPRSFEQEANGTGTVVSLGFLTVPKSSRWSIRVGLDYQRWTTDPGVNQVNFTNGTIITTRLNNVEWKSWALSLGLQRPI
jgi:hypothetical protein